MLCHVEGMFYMATQSRARRRVDLPILLGTIGMWLAGIAFGGIFWAINGGFSVIGLGVMARSFNDSGRLFWAAASGLTFHVPVAVPGLPQTQPLIPWLGVIAASLVQISVTWLRTSGRDVPIPLLIAGIALSIYDYFTTMFGLMTVGWIAAIGWPLAVILAVPITFALEATIGYALRR